MIEYEVFFDNYFEFILYLKKKKITIEENILIIE